MVQQKIDLAAALLDITPKLLRRSRADVPSEHEVRADDPVWRNVTELRATPGQLTLLGILVEHDRCTMQELADHLAVAPSTATAMVKRLFAQGYIERAHDTENWRTVWVQATETGRLAVDIFQRVRIASLQQRLALLSEEERAKITDALPALSHLVDV